MWSRVWDIAGVEPSRGSDFSGNDCSLGTPLVVSLSRIFGSITTWSGGISQGSTTCRRATCRANFIPSIGAKVILLFNARMITARIALGLPSPPQRRSFAELHRVPGSSGYALACITTRPPLSTSMFKLWLSNSRIPTRGVVSATSARTYLGWPSQITATS